MGEPGDTAKFQLPWFDGFDVTRYPGVIQPDGVQALIDLIETSPESVTIISIGAATKIARALELASHIAPKCRFVGMHGSIYLGYAGKRGTTPEANICCNEGWAEYIPIPSTDISVSAQWMKVAGLYT